MNRLTIIVDKSVFQGTALRDLSELALNHSVILPHILFEECLTTEGEGSRGPKSLLEKFEALIKAGAFISLSKGRVLEIEHNTLQPLPSIIDKTTTEQIKDTSIQDFRIDFQKKAQVCKKSFEPMLLIAEKLTKAFWKTLSNKEYSADWRQLDEDDEDNDPSRRFSKWRQATDRQIKSWLESFLPDIHSYITEDWITWHIFQLLVVYGIEWSFKRNQSGQSYENFDITNDVYDLNYLFVLPQSDIFISGDEKLRVFAQAMFPQKAVCSELTDIKKSEN